MNAHLQTAHRTESVDGGYFYCSFIHRGEIHIVLAYSDDDGTVREATPKHHLIIDVDRGLELGLEIVRLFHTRDFRND